MVVDKIFPTAIGREYYKGSIPEMQDFLSEHSNNVYSCVGNHLTVDTHILDSEPFIDIKPWIEEQVINYYNEVLSVYDTVKPYITQSWLSFTNQGDWHHAHIHKNSIISGVFYITANSNNDSIVFSKPNTSMFDIGPKEPNSLNTDSWAVPVSSGTLLLFPSNLMHEVKPHTEKYTRISLAFNTFVKGTLGSDPGLTLLEI